MIAGCGQTSDVPEIAPVRGKVTLDGAPLSLGQISFAPVTGGQTSDATTGPGGEYELIYKRDLKGAKIGKHKVSISSYQPPEVPEVGPPVGGRPELVPAQYNTQTTLEREVVAGENVFDFDLKSR